MANKKENALRAKLFPSSECYPQRQSVSRAHTKRATRRARGTKTEVLYSSLTIALIKVPRICEEKMTAFGEPFDYGSGANF